MAKKQMGVEQHLKQYSAWNVPSLADLYYYENMHHGAFFLYNKTHTYRHLPKLAQRGRNASIEQFVVGRRIDDKRFQEIPLYEADLEQQRERLKRIRSDAPKDGYMQRERLRRIKRLNTMIGELNYTVRGCLLSVDGLMRELSRIEDSLAKMEVRAMYLQQITYK